MKLLNKQKENRVFVASGTETVRMKFAKARKFLNPVNDVIQMGYTIKNCKKGKTALGRAMSSVLRTAMIGTFPNIEVDPAKVKLSSGVKRPLLVYSCKRQEHYIHLRWNPIAEKIHRDELDDGIILCAYAVELQLAAINDVNAYRVQGELQMELPDGMQTAAVHLYLFVHDRGQINFSESQYLGLV